MVGGSYARLSRAVPIQHVGAHCQFSAPGESSVERVQEWNRRSEAMGQRREGHMKTDANSH
jgi:hypothetical protein